MKTILVGNTVSWKAAGKASRAMGIAGQIVSAKVERFENIDGEDYVITAPRVTPFGKHGSLVPVSKILSVKA